jgi:pyruvate,orthophosphate dikinase
MNVLFKGIGASRGRAIGRIVFSSESARPGSILVRIETTHEDAATIRIASAVICTRGGITSDAAIVARTLGKPCVVGCPDVRIDYTARTMTSGEHVLREGDTIEIDGSTGEVGIP